jgi:hypothetical protein
LNWEDVWKITVSIVGGLGGITVIFAAIVRYLSDFIADRLSKKYELRLSKELENYKSSLENKTYISRAKFDTEFAIYRELSSDFSDAVLAINIMVPTGLTMVPADREARLELDKKHYEAAVKAIVKAQDSLKSNIPFIPENIYDGYNELLKLFGLQLAAYEDRFVVTDLRPQSEKETFSRDDYKRTREISEKWITINNKIRKYLNSLEIIE